VIAVTGLRAPVLGLGNPLAVGDDGVIDGYPYGGPFTTGGAQVLAHSTENVDNIYGTSRSSRDLYTLAADVEPGNSGGPLLEQNGSIAGIVFAKSSTDSNLGYAMTDTVLSPVVHQAAGLSRPVSSGTCVKG
jgi:S1-C subfamily serine protease